MRLMQEAQQRHLDDYSREVPVMPPLQNGDRRMDWICIRRKMVTSTHTLASAATMRMHDSASEKAKPPGRKGPPLSTPSACRPSAKTCDVSIKRIIKGFNRMKPRQSCVTQESSADETRGRMGSMCLVDVSYWSADCIPLWRCCCLPASGERPHRAAAAPAPGRAAHPPRCSPARDAVQVSVTLEAACFCFPDELGPAAQACLGLLHLYANRPKKQTSRRLASGE